MASYRSARTIKDDTVRLSCILFKEMHAAEGLEVEGVTFVKTKSLLVRSSHSEVLCKKVFLKWKKTVPESVFNKGSG